VSLEAAATIFLDLEALDLERSRAPRLRATCEAPGHVARGTNRDCGLHATEA